jgi:hypothetical protein
MFMLGDLKKERKSYILYGSAPVNPVGLGIGISTYTNKRTKSPTLSRRKSPQIEH